MIKEARSLEDARDLLTAARRVVVLTGAGISAESGVPTFRGEQGLWKSYAPEDLATPGAFQRNPRLVWEWYGWRREKVAGCAPNPGHLALARRALAGGMLLVTQNVDGLHEMAARAEAGDADPGPALPLELHGALFRDRCTRCGRRSPATGRVDASRLETLPRCRTCNALARPDVVWFGELLDAAALGRAFEEAGLADVCLVVGTSALVHPAASIPAITLNGGGVVVEVNPEATPVSDYARVSVRARAAEALPLLLG
ncbi:MAG TPA: NAD-dependent deacylase [Longimicrobiales bacterium]|nr:NAD-dependent deacylase [Longimicrobiales bacterium]